MARLRDRSTGDLLILMIAGTVCLVVLISSGSLIIGQWLRPEIDDSRAASQIGDIINTLIGVLAGFLAGRSGTALGKNTKEDEPPA